MSYKVLRLLEYTYESAEAADEDMKRWGVPPIGPSRYNGPHHPTIRSAIIQYPEKDEAPHPMSAIYDALDRRHG